MSHRPTDQLLAAVTCRHGVAVRIEPSDEGWMRESCGTCGQLLRWSLWPHAARAVAALVEDVDRL